MLRLPQKFCEAPFSLVLSGGGALGYAHISVLELLEHNSLKPSEIIGSSMGAIVGACLSMNMKSKEIEKLFLKFISFSKWLRPSFKGGLISLKNIYSMFDEVFGDMKIKQSQIPLKIVSYSLNNNKCVIFEDDFLIKEALMASISIPGIFENFSVGGYCYADGCLCENLPVSFSEYELVLAVDVLGKNSLITADEKKEGFNVFKQLEIFIRLMIYNHTKCSLKLIKNKKIFLIEPDVKRFSLYDFNKFFSIKKSRLYGRWLCG